MNRIKNIVCAALVLCTIPLLSVAASAPDPCDAHSGMLAAGTKWATPWYAVRGPESGPTVLVVGGVHGNEPAGYRAAEQVRSWTIARGRLVVIPQLNRRGLAANMRWLPDFRNDKQLRDPNRNFPRSNAANTARTEPCVALWEFVTQLAPDWIVDLHEGFDFHVANSKSVGASLICRDEPEVRALAQQMQQAVNAAITDPKKQLVLLSRSGPVDGSLARAAIERLGCRGLILETCFRDQPISLRTAQHRLMVSKLLRYLRMLDQDQCDVLTGARDQRMKIAIYDGVGTGKSKDEIVPVLDAEPTMVVHHIGVRQIQPAILQQFDVVLFPGGSGSKQARSIGPTGRECIRDWVSHGGGYVGVCAGAYLCSAHYDWSLDLINTSVFTGARDIPGEGKKQMWFRGGPHTVKMELSDAGREILAPISDVIDVRYANGPIVRPGNDPDLPAYRPLAWFRSEVVKWEPQRGTMIDTAAIAASTFGKGRVVSISPHLESDPANHKLLVNAVRWAGSGVPALQATQ